MPTALATQVHRAAGIEAAGQRGAGVKAVLLVVEGAGAAAGIDVGLQHRDVKAGAGQEGGGGQPADAGADDDDAIFAVRCRHTTYPFWNLGDVSISA